MTVPTNERLRRVFYHSANRDVLKSTMRKTLSQWEHRFPERLVTWGSVSKFQHEGLAAFEEYEQLLLHDAYQFVARTLELDRATTNRLSRVQRVSIPVGSSYVADTMDSPAIIAMQYLQSDTAKSLDAVRELVHIVEAWRGLEPQNNTLWSDIPAFGIELLYAESIAAPGAEMDAHKDSIIYAQQKLHGAAPWSIKAMNLHPAAMNEPNSISRALSILARDNRGDDVYARLIREPDCKFWNCYVQNKE